MYKVMIVEDEELILEGIRHLIDWEALDLRIVHLAGNGQEALQCYEKEPVDLVITDLNMPVMDGLTLLGKLRTINKNMKFLILSGYDDFTYAQKAISLQIERYILKPINEEELAAALEATVEKFKEYESNKNSPFDKNTNILRFLEGRLTIEQVDDIAKIIGFNEHAIAYGIGNMTVKRDSKVNEPISLIIEYLQTKQENKNPNVFLFPNDEIIIIHEIENEKESVIDYFNDLQVQIENDLSVSTFLTVGERAADYLSIPQAYKSAKNLQKYRIIEGYGSTIDLDYIENRKTSHISMEGNRLHKMMIERNKEEACAYVEDIFINCIKKESITLEGIYHLSIQVTMILQEIINDFNFTQVKKIKGLQEVIDEIYEAEDLFVLKNILLTEITEIIDLIQQVASDYSPVVVQIIRDVHENYKEDMNLKTLSLKYHINPSYLGHIFQKELGCTFSQYLSNMKNSKAKEMILNTNLKINDIAKEVGYPDSTYFHRKFKQYYGVSPASLREMKQY